MAYTPPIFSVKSAIGVNSYVLTSPSGALWNGINFQGAGEENDFAYVGINLQTDEAGTLTFEFSQDGINWSKYPVTDFTITAGINEVHTAWKGGRYLRPIYSGSDGSKTYFRLQTYYSNHPLPLSAPLNQSIGSDQDATVVRSVITGQQPDGTFSNQKQIGYGVSTTTVLSGSEVFQSDWIEISGYQQVQTHISSDVDGTMKFEFAEDSAGADIHRTLNIPYQASQGFQLLSAPCFTKYVRYTYTNGTTPQTNFLYDTKLLTTGLSGQVLPLNGNLASAMVANLGRNVIVGQDDAGNFRNTNVNEFGDLKTQISNPTTAFGEIKIAENDPQIQISFPYNINLDQVITGSNGTATISHSGQLAQLSTGVTANSSASMKTIRTAKYRNGQGINFRGTALFTTGSSAGTKQLLGIGDENNGFFFGMSGSSFGIYSRNAGVETFTSQSSFSSDRFDGVGDTGNSSGVALAPEFGNVFDIKFQWLGFGAITFDIEKPDEGEFGRAHILAYANANTIPSLENPTYPIRWEVSNGGNAEDVTLKVASAAAFVEGINKITGPQNSISVAEASSANNNLLTLKNELTFPSGSSTENKVRVFLRVISLGNDGNQINSIKIVKNATLPGPSWSYIDPDKSVITWDTGSTYTANSGKTLLTYTLVKDDSITADVTNLEIEIDPGDTLSFIGSGVSTNTSTNVTWVEDF